MKIQKLWRKYIVSKYSNDINLKKTKISLFRTARQQEEGLGLLANSNFSVFNKFSSYNEKNNNQIIILDKEEKEVKDICNFYEQRLEDKIEPILTFKSKDDKKDNNENCHKLDISVDVSVKEKPSYIFKEDELDISDIKNRINNNRKDRIEINTVYTFEKKETKETFNDVLEYAIGNKKDIDLDISSFSKLHHEKENLLKDFKDFKNEDYDLLEKDIWGKKDDICIYDNMLKRDFSHGKDFKDFSKIERDVSEIAEKELKEIEDIREKMKENEIVVNNNTNKNTEERSNRKSLLDRVNKMIELEEQPNQENTKYSKLNESHSTYNKEASYEITNLRIELKERKKTIDKMKILIEDQRKEIITNKESYEKDIKQKLAEMKFHYDTIIDKQNTYTEALNTEKKRLININQEITEKLALLEKTYQKKLNSVQEEHELETKKNKDAWYKLEKMKRKEWEEKKVKEIEQNTIKGLEPEVERILHNYKSQLTKLEEQYNEDLKQTRDRMNNEFDRRMREMKDRFSVERDEAIDHERKLSTQRLRTQAERLEEEFNEERRRWNNNIHSESQRLDHLRENDKKLFEQQLKKLEERSNMIVEEKEKMYENKISTLIRQNEEKLKLLEEDFKIKLEKEKNLLKDENMKLLEKKSKDMKLELTKDRDLQIKTVIDKLSEDTLQERKKLKQDAEKKAEEVCSSLKIENEHLRQKLNELTEKYSAEYKNRNLLDDNLDSLSKKYEESLKEISKKEERLYELNSSYKILSTKYESIVGEFSREKQELENFMKISILQKDDEIKFLKMELENKIKRIENLQVEEIKVLEERFARVLSSKEAKISKLDEQVKMLEFENLKYNEMMEEMRTEYLKK